MPVCMYTVTRVASYSTAIAGLQYLQSLNLALCPFDVNLDGSLLLELLKMATRAADLPDVQV